MRCLIALLITTSVFAQNYAVVEGAQSQQWMEFSRSSEVNVQRLLELLGRSTTGGKLLSAAQRKADQTGLKLLDVVIPGESSITDTTLIRRFHPEQPDKIDYHVESKIYLNRHLTWKDGLLDLAHELQHYIARDVFNPYQDNYDLEAFILSTIEGVGGEVQAFLTECQVLSELFSQKHYQESACGDIDPKLSRAEKVLMAKKLFYQVGSFYPQMQLISKKFGLSDKFDLLTDKKIKFISSAYGLPYPVAAYYEYQTVLNKVCENDRKRLAYLRQDKGRSPASYTDLAQKLSRRCQLVTQQD
jgi:hypothetical protein